MSAFRIRVLILGLILGIPVTLDAQSGSRQACESTDVAESWGSDAAAQARTFVKTLQTAIKNGDQIAVTDSVLFPLRIYMNGKTRTVSSRTQFLQLYGRIMSPGVRKAIVSQNPECLFANADGVMIGDGEIWFAPQKDGTMKIYRILPDAPR